MNPFWTIIPAFLAVLGALLLPARHAHQAKRVALTGALLGMLSAVCLCAQRLGDVESAAWSYKAVWIPSVGANFHLAADGIALVLLLLTGIVAVAGVLFSWNVTKRPRAFFAWYMTIIGGVYGVFLSRDALLLFVFYEVVILPKYMLISIWGSTNREYGAMKLTMYSIGASALILAGLCVAYAAAGGISFDLHHLAAANYDLGLQSWAFPLLFLGFAVLAGIWPFHTWAPTGHVAAPTAASMLLAGVVMKLGAFGVLMVAMPLFPQGFAQWQGVIAGLAVIGILYGALTALAQRDLKFVIGYSSVSHMGFILLGLAAASHWGLRGAVLQMISHGVIAGLLFGIAGRVIYERTHTRDLTDLESFRLWKNMPFVVVAFTMAMAASMGLPGFSGFVAEISIIIGVWEVFPMLTLAVALGIILTGAFSLRAVQKTCFSKPAEVGLDPSPAPKDPPPPLSPLTWPERSAILLLLAVSIAIGLYPKPWIILIDDGLASPLFHAILSTP